MNESKKKQFYLMLLCGLVLLAVIVGALVLLFEEKASEPEISSVGSGQPAVPPGRVRIEDLYEGSRLIPKYDLPKSTCDPAKFHDRGNGIITYSDLDATLGVDVSEHQGEIDWARVKDAGVEFAILRLGYRGQTEGLLYTDEKFEQNYLNASAQELPLGVYFFSQAVTEAEARAEAQYVLEVLGKRKLDYPVVFDWEHPTPGGSLTAKDLRAFHCTGAQVTEMAAAFCEEIKKGGYSPAVYFNKTMAYESIDLERLKKYDFWYAEYQKQPSLYYDFDIWQYSESGSIAGIGGAVDLNIAFTPYAS